MPLRVIDIDDARESSSSASARTLARYLYGGRQSCLWGRGSADAGSPL
jgi:hypothetical protein